MRLDEKVSNRFSGHSSIFNICSLWLYITTGSCMKPLCRCNFADVDVDVVAWYNRMQNVDRSKEF